MMDENNPTTYQIRILNGPLQGVTHTVGQRVEIGRASSSDIQLVHDGISRQHAQIVVDDEGNHMLVDLASSNGTFVAGKRIRRHQLGWGTIFKIMQIRMVYEPTTSDYVDLEESGVYAVRRVDHNTFRGTIDYDDLDCPQLCDHGESKPSPSTLFHSAPNSTPTTSVRQPLPPTPPPHDTEERHRVVAIQSDGTVYPGDVIDDIVGYRQLRNRSDRGDALTAEEDQRFQQLEPRLRVPRHRTAPPERRGFHRFKCMFPGRLRFSDGTEKGVQILDIGVDGAKIRVYDHAIEFDSLVWLAIHLVSRGRSSTVAFTCQVTWTCRDHVGLSFAGSPDWGHRRQRDDPSQTPADLGSSVPVPQPLQPPLTSMLRR